MISSDSEQFAFIPGQYHVSVFAHLLGDQGRKLLFSQRLAVSTEQAEVIGEHGAGIYFDWSPDKLQYVSHIKKEPKSF